MNRSASAPGISAAPKQLPQGQGWRNHMESVLLVAEDSGPGGAPVQWWPFRFAHQRSGVLAFEPLGGGAEFFVNADWTQPFVAGPCRPVPVPPDLAWLMQQQGGKATGKPQLYPFTLSYSPVPDPSEKHKDTLPRRSILLAATDARVRASWLTNFSHKAHAPELRYAQPPAKRVAPPPSATKRAGQGSAAPLLPHQHLVTLGHEHSGLPALPAADRGRALGLQKGAASSAASLRLSAGVAALWEPKSEASLCRHSIVRDLLDGYAADPLGSAAIADDVAVQAASRPRSQASRAGSSRQSMRRVSLERREKEDVFQRYVERQAEIEALLRRKLSGPPPAQPQPQPQQPPVPDERAAAAEQGEEPEEEGPVVPLLELAARTVNTVLDGDVLTAEKWSGGAVFRVPSEGAFSLAITPLDPLLSNPIFFGLVPPSTDLARVNFFDAGTGVLLCMGGQPSAELISALRESGAPAFYAFGTRTMAELPLPKPGQSISVHYKEDADCAQVHFVVGDADGEEEVYGCEPRLPRPIPRGWLPCVLLCIPGTRVRVKPPV